MKVTISYSVELEEVRQKIKDLTNKSIESLHPHLSILSAAVDLFEDKSMSAESLSHMINTLRKSLASVDNSFIEIDQLITGLSRAETAIEQAIKPTSSAIPDPRQGPPAPEGSSEKYDQIVEKISELKNKVGSK